MASLGRVVAFSRGLLCLGLLPLLLHRETVDAILLPELAGEAEAADAGVWKPPAVRAGSSDGEAHAAVLQPASVATV